MDQPGDLVPEVEATFLCLMGHNDSLWDGAHEIGADLVHVWCARGTAAQATLALLLSAQFNAHGERFAQDAFKGYFPYVGPWKALRGYLAQCPDEVYREAFGYVKELAWGRLRWVAAVAFPTETEFVNEVVGELLQGSAEMTALGLLSAVQDPGQFEALASLQKNYINNVDFTAIKLDDFLLTAVARMGEGSWPGLRVFAEAVEKAGEKRMLGELLDLLDHPEVGPWLSARAKDKVWGPIAHARKQRSASAPSRPVARACDAPAILLHPPWETPVKKAKPWQKTLLMRDFPEVVHFATERLKLIRDNREQAENKALRTRWEKGGDCFFPDMVWEMQDEAWALKIWNESPASKWNPYSLRSSF